MALLIRSAVGLVIKMQLSQSVQGEEKKKDVLGVTGCMQVCVSR